MTKQINIEWMNELLEDRKKREFEETLPQIDWVSNGKSFKKEIKFKLIPGNSKEENIFGRIVATHWIDTPNGRRRFICPEKTQHLKKQGAECPICAAKRKLLAKGFTEEDLSVQGKFGLIPVFDPVTSANVKVVVLGTDLRSDWDKAHISILQQKGTFLVKWLAEKYAEADTPDILEWGRSNVIRFSRPTDNGRWEREITFASYEPTQEVLEKLKEENEALTLADLWRMPSDQDLIEFRQIAADMVKSYEDAKNAINEVSSIADDDSIPF